ncbi:MAG: MerR family transcriptional regulator [Rikenellaceae bacterium]
MNKEENNKKIFYSISEVADMFDLTQTQLRNWEKQFPQLKPHRNRKGNRQFTPEDIENLKIIYNLLKVKGLKINSAVKEIGISENHLRRNSQITEKLLSIKSQLSSILENLSDNEKDEIVVYND